MPTQGSCREEPGEGAVPTGPGPTPAPSRLPRIPALQIRGWDTISVQILEVLVTEGKGGVAERGGEHGEKSDKEGG